MRKKLYDNLLSKVDNQYMQIVEEAIKGYTKIRFKYRSANAEKSTIQEVSPIGLIFVVLVI